MLNYVLRGKVMRERETGVKATTIIKETSKVNLSISMLQVSYGFTYWCNLTVIKTRFISDMENIRVRPCVCVKENFSINSDPICLQTSVKSYCQLSTYTLSQQSVEIHKYVMLLRYKTAFHLETHLRNISRSTVLSTRIQNSVTP